MYGEGVGRWGWAEVGCCAGEEGRDWVGHFFFFGRRGVKGRERGELCGILFFFFGCKFGR